MRTSTHQPTAAAVYNAAAECFDTAAQSCWDRFGLRTVERLRLPEGAHVLDACCGAGGSALPAAERVGPGGRVLGFDLAEELLARARAKAERRGLDHVEIIVADLETLDGVTGTFDAVVCVFGIFFVPDMAGALRRLWARVRPDGALAVTSWGPRLFEPASTAFWDGVRQEAPALHKAFSPWERIAESDDLRALFDEAGIPGAHVEAESGTHSLRDPEDWWTIVLGSGYRGTLEQLPPAKRDALHGYVMARLARERVNTIETNVLYAVARRP